MTVINPFSKGLVLNNNISLTWPVLVTFCMLPFPFLTSYPYTCTALTCTHEQRIFSSFLFLISPECLEPFLHSMDINILVFNPMSPALILIPPNK